MANPSLGLMSRPWVLRQRTRARELQSRYVDRQLHHLQRARRRLLRGEVDILLLGDSSCLFGAPRDTDRALIPEMLARETGARVTVLAGAGYSAAIHAEFLRILGMLPVRPRAVVTSVCVRTSATVHVTRHPTYAYPASLAAMDLISGPRDRIRAFRRTDLPGPAEYAAFEALPVTTRWGGTSTIGEFRTALKGHGPPPWAPDTERRLFDYFHGEVVTPDNPGLARWSEFGRQVAAYGVPTVSYRTVPPIGRGELHFPGEFAELAWANRAVVDKSIRATAGPLHQLVGDDLDDDDFVDSRDATEHFSSSGRLKIVRTVVDTLPG